MANGEKKSLKRPSQDAGGSSGTTNKKKRKRKHLQEHDEADLDVETGLNRAYERMDSQLLADHIAQKTTRFGTDLSSVELSDLYISGEQGPAVKPMSMSLICPAHGKRTQSKTRRRGRSRGRWRTCQSS